jgi:hypothetical protein
VEKFKRLVQSSFEVKEDSHRAGRTKISALAMGEAYGIFETPPRFRKNEH